MSKQIVKIKKPWEDLADQEVADGRGGKWSAVDLVYHARDLKPMDVPLTHMSCDYKIGGMSLREFVGHMRLVLEADLDCSIILCEDGTVVDGRHRMARALLEELTSIKAVRFEKDPPSTVEGPEESEE